MKKDKIVHFFEKLGRFSAVNKWAVLGVTLAVTAAAFIVTTRLKIEMNWVDLVPSSSPSVKEFHSIAENFGATSSIILAIEHPDNNKLKKIAEEISADIITYTNYFKRVDYKLNSDFILNHALMLQKAKDLKNAEEIFKSFDLNPYLKSVNDNFEKTYIGGEEDLEGNENELIQNINSLMDTLVSFDQNLEQTPSVAEAGGRLSADNYFEDQLFSFSLDKNMLIVNIQPNCTINDIDEIAVIVPALRGRPLNFSDVKSGDYDYSDIFAHKRKPGIIDKYKEKYPDANFRLTGFHIIAQDEMEIGTQDSMILTVIAFIIILVAFMLIFRMIFAPVLAMVVLIIGIIWNLAITTLIIGRLNIMTAFTAAILIGLGIDYFIHLVTCFTEARCQGMNTVDAAVYMMKKTSTGVLVGGLTTAIAFYALTISKMDMLRELGFVLGSGIITTLAASFIILPAALALFAKKDYTKNKNISNIFSESKFFYKIGLRIEKKPGTFILAGLILLALFAFFIRQNWFDQNILNIEMKNLESVLLQREMIKRFGLSDGSLVFTTDSVEEAQEYFDLIDPESSVGMIDSIAGFIPSRDNQLKRLPYLRKIHDNIQAYQPSSKVNKDNLAKEIRRFEMNLLELEQMSVIGGQKLLEYRLSQILSSNSFSFSDLAQRILDLKDSSGLTAFQAGFGKQMKKYFLSMANPVQIKLSDIPEDILDNYLSDDGSKYLFSAYSKSDIWHNPTKSRFISFMMNVNQKVTGTPVFMKVLIADTAREGSLAVLFSLVAIIILLIIDLRKVTDILLAILPLLLGGILLFGITGLLNYPYTIISVMFLPLIIGIGIDDGIHLIHRNHIENGNIPLILNTTGKALFLTSFTTMVAFGSLMFAKWQGFVGMGLVLFVGIGACFIVTILFIPALMVLINKRSKK